MKRIFLFTFFLLYYSFFCQSWEIKYNFELTDKVFNHVILFPAHLQLDKQGKKLYTVKYGISDQIAGAGGNINGITIQKGGFDYIFYSEKATQSYIREEVGGKTVIFKDDFLPVKFALIDEYKMLGKIKLNRAETTFRGRNYTIWYDAAAKVKGGPWIFSDLPGLSYEIYDDEDRYRWTLQKIMKQETEIENPFSKEELYSAISYKEFPKLKYNIQVYFYDESKKRGEYKSSEQKRTGLERTFEWEN